MKDTAANKILLLGDYSNCHANLAKGLRKLGREVTVMAPVNYLSSKEVDIDTSRKSGKIGGLMLYLKALTKYAGNMKGYDVVAINDPVFLNLRPERLLPIFKRLKANNRAIFYTAMSNDVNYLRMCQDDNSPLKFSEFFIDCKPSPWYLENPGRFADWFNPSLVSYEDFVFDNLDGAVSVLYEYHKGLEYRFDESKIAYGGISVNTGAVPFVGIEEKPKIRMFLGRDKKRIKMKGADILEMAANNIVGKYPDKVELKIAENIPYKDFVEELKKSDIVLDQVYSYTPATTALLSMAMGKTVVSGGETEYYDFIGEKENRPIINASYDVDELTRTLENLVLNRDFIKSNAYRSREFVEKHNDIEVVARRFLDFWDKKLNEKK